MKARKISTRLLAIFVMALPLAAATLAAEPSAEALRQAFLACEREASSTLMSSGDAARCSRTYEQLLKREFQGDFAKLLAWWQAQRLGQVTAPPATPRT